ncbi:hypothetical protein FOCC_FOCC013706, partial [Frankliniella occidentalis]
MCGTCYRYVCNENIPPLAVINGFKYLPVPSHLDRLTEVEEHILALRLPFQQIVHLGKLGKLGQYGCKGSVINVPTNSSDVVHKIIPLLPEDDQLCIVNIKRKLIHKRAYARNFVDKTKITTWAKFLVKSSLYKEYGVIFDEKRLCGFDVLHDEPCLNEFGNKVYTASDDPETEAEMFDRLESVELDVSSEKKLQLIRDDPIVCATYFREMVLLLKKYLRRTINGPMGQYYMIDWFFRIEFQQRGSPHVHCLLWINNGVSDPLKDKEAAIKLIDSLITCDSSNPLAEKNIHRHTHTCFKNKRIKKKFANKLLSAHECHKYCRFGAPFWPTNNTRILQPLYEEEDERLKLKDVLASEDCPDDLDEIWAIAGCVDDEMYELAIRTGLVRPTVLYKRSVADRWTNPHLKWTLAAFIGNVRYCVSYVTKGEKSHSQLYSEIMKLRAEHNFDDRTLLKMLCSTSLRAKETSAQEAAWILLNFPLSEASRMCVFIDTSLPSERCRSPKNKKALLALPEGSTDLWYLDVFDLYTARPEALKKICLAEFVAYYHQSKNYKRRNHARVIRYRKFKENSDDVEEKENFYRGMCTLYLPWENEVNDILSYGANDKSFVDLYNVNEQVILSNRIQFEPLIGAENVLEEELQTCVGEEEEIDENDCERRSVIGGAFKLIFDDEVEVVEYMNSEEQNVDIDLSNCGLDQSFEVVEVKRRGVWSRDEFLSNIRVLNSVQREIVLSVIHGIRLGIAPCLIYVDGAAGTGKSVVARNIANAFETFSPGNNYEDSRVVITAFTGKAAYNIGGVTMHQAYKLSLNQEVRASERLKAGDSTIMNPLQHQALANLQNYFTNVNGQIIDEISLVSDRNFLAVDQRCKEAKRNNSDFESVNAGRVDEELIDSLSCYDSDFSEVESTDVDDCDNSVSDSDIVSTVIEGINEKQHREADNVDTRVAKKLKQDENF